CKMASKADPVSDRARDDRVVARQHYAILHPHATKTLQYGSALRTYLVRIGHHSGQRAIDRDVDARAALLLEGGAVGCGLTHADTALSHEALVADVQVIAVDLTFHAEPDAVLRFVAGRDVGPELLRPRPQRLGDRMLQSRLRGCGQSEQVGRCYV